MSGHECGYNHLTEEQVSLIKMDAAMELVRIIQDVHHNAMPQEVALEVAIYAINSGLQQAGLFVDNAMRLNKVTAAVALSGFAGDDGNG